MVSPLRPVFNLMRLVRACVDGDEAGVGLILSENAELALRAAARGASRDSAKEFFFESIQHYLYAGDTALHLAAAAFRPNIARMLIAHGAVRDARNRRGAAPLHYAADTNRWDPEAQAETINVAGAARNARVRGRLARDAVSELGEERLGAARTSASHCDICASRAFCIGRQLALPRGRSPQISREEPFQPRRGTS